ncbi:MAG: hypothetical protein AAF696_15880 [Bacteroidota bacterium]
MKSLRILMLLSLSSLIFSAQAQIRIGLTGGLSRAWQDYGPVAIPEDGEVHVMGMNLRATAYYSLGKYLSIGIEPGFVERGAACIPGFIIFEGDTKFFLDYAQAPVMLMGKLPLFQERIEVFGKLGYGASFIISGQREDTPNNDEPIAREQIQLGPNSILNRWDHGAYGGLGVGLNLGKTQLFVAADVYAGFRDVERANFSKNRSISINLGVSRELF